MNQTLKDVYEILVKNGEIPENVTENHRLRIKEHAQSHLMINPNLMFDNNRRVKSEIMCNDTPASEIPSTLLLDSNQEMIDMTILSPMQHHEAVHNNHEEETLDKLLAQVQQTNEIGTSHMSVCKQNSVVLPLHTQDLEPSPLTDFNDLELMEFQMDIEDDSCHQAFSHDPNGLIPQSDIKEKNNALNDSNKMRNHCNSTRDMNPSLTPSLNALIHLQPEQNNDTNLMNGYQNTFTNNTNNNTNSHFHNETPMDFENLLSNFDLPSNISESSLSHLNHHSNGGYDSLSSPSSHHFDGNCFNYGDTNSPCNVINYVGSNNNSHHHHHENILDFFNDDFKMSTSETMSCEVDNLLCNI